MTDLRAALAAEFTNGEVRQFQGRGGQTFDYIEDETVMDRLDDALGVGNWSVTVEPISLADGVVKVRLNATMPDGAVATFEDFGYANNIDGDALKEAVSDGIRRCGRFLGVGRYLYKKHVVRRTAAVAPPARPPLRAVSQPTSQPDDPYGDDLIANELASAQPSDAICAQHGIEWRGEAGDLYHKKDDGGYCRHPDNVRKARAAR